MLFNSNTFLIFFAIILGLYHGVCRTLFARNLLILLASYVFYGWWDYHFLALLICSSLVDFGVGLALGATNTVRFRKAILFISVLVNLSFLGFFKYYDFFAKSFASMVEQLGWHVDLPVLQLVLPIGISFYTFQSLSYAIDVYRETIKPTRNLVNFLAHIAFFPQLVAGPIERATNLLPQFERTLTVTWQMFEEGFWLILWGLFKKVVIADSLYALVSLIFGNAADLDSGPLTILGSLAFGVQIYCDFSGYSDIARGTAKWLGFELMMNFNLPYLSRSLIEFWRRWHISLSTWIRDYLYYPLGGNRLGPSRSAANLVLTMLLAGLWHGAGLNFVSWGLWHGFALLVARGIARFTETSRGWRVVQWMWMIIAVFYGWLLFRAQSVDQIYKMTVSLTQIQTPIWFIQAAVYAGIFILPLAIVELVQSFYPKSTLVSTWPVAIRGCAQAALILGILFYWERREVPFIYFQF